MEALTVIGTDSGWAFFFYRATHMVFNYCSNVQYSIVTGPYLTKTGKASQRAEKLTSWIPINIDYIAFYGSYISNRLSNGRQ